MPSDKVLVVDDDAEIRELLSSVHISAGFHVITAEKGTLALEMAKKEILSVAVVDFDMPGLFGMETVRQMIHEEHEDTRKQILSAPWCPLWMPIYGIQT